ncbi:BACON domain-containing protein [uncultured Phocaeicola sp.]|nr:BACON domain-containing protein [uncultured Phocaeicola sp.]
MEAEGGTIEIKVDANVEYTVTTSDNWVKQITTRTLSTETLRFTITANESENQRAGSITLTGGDITKIIAIRQAGKDNTSGGIDDMPTQPW